MAEEIDMDELERLQLALVMMRLIQDNPKNKDLHIKSAADKLDKMLAEVGR